MSYLNSGMNPVTKHSTESEQACIAGKRICATDEILDTMGRQKAALYELNNMMLDVLEALRGQHPEKSDCSDKATTPPFGFIGACRNTLGASTDVINSIHDKCLELLNLVK